MTDFIDYDTICLDAAAALRAANLGLKKVINDAGDTDFVFENMPLADVRLKRLVPEALGGRNYYSAITLEIEVGAFDMTNRRQAAKIRNDLANAIQRYFQANPRFSVAVDTTLVGNAEFEAGESQEQGAFVASAILNFTVQLYSNG